MWRSICLVTVLVCVPAGRELAAGEPLDGLESRIAQALDEWQVPGLAIAIVKDDRVVLAKGLGLRKVGDATAVDSGTLFAIGSTSKAFTAATLAMLVDEGKLNWDDPVSKYLSGFQLYDPLATRELTVRDLLCHRSGLPRGDALWYGTSFDRAEILRRVRYLKPESSFRSKFGYQNIMYLAAGEVTATIGNSSWDAVVKERLFLPLGMKSSNTSVTALAAGGNVATPHEKVDDAVQPIPWRNIDNVGPAGSINSNVEDMAQWIRLQLGQGTVDGKHLISAAAIKEMRASQTIIPRTPEVEDRDPDGHFLAYGLGWVLHDYKGRLVAEHGGGIDGMTSQVALLPEEKLGVVILSNRGSTALPQAVARHVCDRYLQVTSRDALADMLVLQSKAEQKEKDERAKQDAARVKDTKPSLAIERYAGTFTSELYGPATVTHADGKLSIERGGRFPAQLVHWHFDTFQAKFHDRAVEPQLITFELDSAGNVSALIMPGLGRFDAKVPK